MPEWCHNRLVIRKRPGRPFDPVQALRELHPNPRLRGPSPASRVLEALSPHEGEEVLSFERLLPTPENVVMSDEWEQWRLHYWGTVFDASHSKVVDQYLHLVTVTFRTAWEPPESWFRELAQQRPNWDMELSFVAEHGGGAGRWRTDHQ
jgi:hypothetical protein